MGICEERFWNMNPAMLRPYQKAYDLRRSYDNQLAWLHGLYVWNALQSALSGFGGKKSKRVEYLKEPIPINETEKEEADRKKMERMKAQFGAFVQGLEEKINGR